MKIIVTGASRGIGFDTALELAVNNEHDVLAISRNESRLRQLSEAVLDREPRGRLQFLSFDLTQPDWGALDQAMHELDGLDVLINNAGQLIKKPFSGLTESDWQRSFEVNCLGPVRLIRHLLPLLEQADRAHVLNIGSMGGFQGSSKFPGLSAYSASKAALANVTECLAEEFGDKGIAVNCLAIGAVQTEMLQEAFPGYEPPLTSAQMSKYLAHFATTGHHFYNGKILPVSVSTP